ncbi:MAG: TRAP transporter permease, partial [Thermodesulfovibrionales bacterium]|nr:TRAP transporter permease [Thermodesulfovibrionales bacterium]
MSGPVVGIYGILIMFAVLFILRMPAAVTMALVGFLGIVYMTSFEGAISILTTDLWNIFSSYGLTVIPLFILLGEFVHYAGYNNSLYHATYKWFGHYKGGLAMTTIMASAAFSAISGSNT